MNNLNMKNIIVLKDLPSNTIDEAIVILKDNKIKKGKNFEVNSEFINTNIIDEAQNIISNYIEKIEQPKKNKINENRILIKYKKLQIFTMLLTGMLIISFLISFIK